MFTESMFSTPRGDAQKRGAGDFSAWPAVGAASFAWFISLMRLVIGQACRESMDLDLALAAGATLVVPAIVSFFWLSDRRFRRTEWLDRVPLSVSRLPSSPSPPANFVDARKRLHVG